MKYWLPAIMLILLTSLCAGLPKLPFFQENKTQEASMAIIDLGSPDMFLKIEAIPSKIKSGRTLFITFELKNKHTYELKNVIITAYDQCLFSGENKKEINILKPNQTVTWTWKWSSQKTDFDTNCNIKFKTSYEATALWSQGIAALNQIEYEQRELSGTLKDLPIPSFYPDSPLGISFPFSNEQPFLGNGEEEEYMYIDYSNRGNGYIYVDKGDITITFPSNMHNVQCDDYDSSGSLIKSLNFIKGRATRSTCSFTPMASKPVDIQTLSLTANYKYVFDNSIIVRVLGS